MKPSRELLRLHGVGGRYAQGVTQERDAVSGVTVTLQDTPGLVALIGPNGSGKTTLLRLIAGQMPLASGEMWLLGCDVTTAPTHRRVGLAWLFQRALDGMCSSLTVEENLDLMLMPRSPSTVHRMVTRERRRRILEKAEEVAKGTAAAGGIMRQLQHRLRRYPTEFSGGEIQQISMLALMLREPSAKLVLADEPTLNLDKANREICLEMLRALTARTTVLLATHDQEIISISTRRLVLEEGRLVSDCAAVDGSGGSGSAVV